MPDLVMLIGLQGSGKSTYRKKLTASKSDYVIISLDDMLEEYAQEKNITYNEAWKQADMKEFNKTLKYRDRKSVV